MSPGLSRITKTIWHSKATASYYKRNSTHFHF